MKTPPAFVRISSAVVGLILVVVPVKAEVLFGLSTTNTLLRFDSATPATILTSVNVTGLQAGESLLGIDLRPANNALYGLGSTSRLYAINPTTGTATQVGSAGAFTLSGTAFGFDFNPTLDQIRVVSNTGQNLRLNPNNGTLTSTDTALLFAAADPNTGTTPRAVGLAYSNNTAGALSTTLYTLDSNLDILALQGSPGGSPLSPNTGQLFTIGAPGFNTSDLAGFDISGATGTAYAALTAPTANASQLFSVNLATGAATLIGTIGGGAPVHGLTAGPGAATGVPDSGSSLILLGSALAVLTASRRRFGPKA